MRQVSLAMQPSCPGANKFYEEAVRTLNTLQSNAAFLERVRCERDKKRHLSLPETIETCVRAGVSLDALDQLNVIHVSGTKGKGSTCAFIESILRAHGYKTGFFSSPHLVEVRERIRLNGHPLSREGFSAYFWDVFRRLDSSKEQYGGNMPMYFRFLTVMAAHVFIQEKVDVAILEVGIGGEYDCTNIVRQPKVCAVTSLGIDHTSILGDTLDKIAWHKAGIFKKGVPAITVEQPDGCLDVLKARAQEIGSPLFLVASDIRNYTKGDKVKLGIPGAMQPLNAALATQVCETWMQRKEDRQCEDLYNNFLQRIDKEEHIIHCSQAKLTDSVVKGLEQCRWLGRSQIVHRDRVTYYLDGAHTNRSLEACANWFNEASANEARTFQGPVVRLLLFNTTGDRKPELLLQPLIDCEIQYAMFCPNIVAVSRTNSADQTNFTVTKENQLCQSVLNMNVWLSLLSKNSSEHHSSSLLQSVHSSLSNHTEQLKPNTDQKNAQSTANSDILSKDECDSGVGSRATPEHQNVSLETCATHFGSIMEALLWISQDNPNSTVATPNSSQSPGSPTVSPGPNVPRFVQEAAHIQVLCTGSLHLVGGILGILDPDLSGK